jgi:hypothetical protein
MMYLFALGIAPQAYPPGTVRQGRPLGAGYCSPPLHEIPGCVFCAQDGGSIKI